MLTCFLLSSPLFPHMKEHSGLLQELQDVAVERGRGREGKREIETGKEGERDWKERVKKKERLVEREKRDRGRERKGKRDSLAG